MRRDQRDTPEGRLRTAFDSQKCVAGTRLDRDGNPIAFNFTYEEWVAVWEASGKLSQRGRKKGDYVMSRKEDRGAYEVGNVEIITVSENRRRHREWQKFTKEQNAKRAKNGSATRRVQRSQGWPPLVECEAISFAK